MSAYPRRLAAGGRIDRARRLRFSLDGRAYEGFAGDTLASALLAGGVRIVGRSFKYHRPRGFLAAGVEEPNGLFTVSTGDRTTPNVPGTTLELHEGLSARCQNGFPSVRFDLMRVNSLVAPLIGAGFYYKTFMGPRRGSWMWYEPFIRRAAGLGRAQHAPDPDRYETSRRFTDVLVIGAGPAGLAAAHAAGAAGARVLLIEQDSLVGGGLLAARVDGTPGAWLESAAAALERFANVTTLTRTTAFGLYDGNTVALVTRAAPGAVGAREHLALVSARAIVFATGALERPLVFADNDRPGIMLSSAVQTYRHRYALALGKRLVLATNNDAAWHGALELARDGVGITIIEQRAQVDESLRAAAAQATVAVELGARVTRALGSGRLRGVRVLGSGGRERELECELLALSGGWSPTLHLTSHTGVKPVYRADLDAFVPGALAPGQFGAGAVLGTLSPRAAAREGQEAGARAAAFAGFTLALPARWIELEPLAERSYGSEPARPAAAARGKAFVDFQSDVTLHDLEVAHQEGFESVEHLKRYTTLGMGTDQGKTSNLNAIALMAGLRSQPIPEVGTTTFRPPYTPVSIGALVGRNVGHHFRPVRRSPLHDWHVANGAVMIEAGPWLRAWYYRWAGATAAAAYVEEMRLVRTSVGISDVSTLGKIEVQGPDVGEFLDRVYVNNFAKLAVGKARYGVMLNDDATVLDDGTSAHLGETRWFMTTTTAQAADVMSHLEFLLETAWPELDVHVVSVTDEWAGMSVAGPQARAALERALPGVALSDGALPHMGCREVLFEGTALRILRLSFSGELAYELYVAADRGIWLWERILAAAAPLAIRPYGLEALASLRIEKGHVAGLELDRRTTLDDLGLSRMASTTKAYVGRELRERRDLRAPERWSLVGLETLNAGDRLRGGAILFAPGDPVKGHGRGYITSVTFSTELERYIALGLYQGGLTHLGSEVLCAYPLKGETVRARIVSPVFVDPKGTRLHV